MTQFIFFVVVIKVLAALSFYATGKYQKSIGGRSDPSITQYFVATAVMQVTEAMNDPSIIKKYIHFPHLRNEREVIKNGYFLLFLIIQFLLYVSIVKFSIFEFVCAQN